MLLRLFGRRLPTTRGTVRVAGIHHPITVGRDRFGVPHVRADDDVDAWFGLGFCQGQDRAFQLETRLRLVRGTLAALVGMDGVPLDRLSRRIDFAGSGRRGVAALGADHLAGYEAFAAGVRAGMTEGGGARAHEFMLLRARPTPFEASDAIGFFAVQAFSLASNWDAELARLQILTLDGPDAVAALHPPYPADQPVSARPGEAAGRVVDSLADDLARARALFTAGGGSNNWAIAGTRTRSGQPILANDPHLAPLLPAHWYLAHVETPEWSIVGGAIPGTPGFGFGHNGSAAWGVTAGLIDNTDLFAEEIGPDTRSVRRGTEFVPCEVRSESIEVKGSKEPLDIDVLVTDRGPIVSPAFEGRFGALSMAATWFDPGNVGAILDMSRIASFDAMHEAFRDWSTVSLNVAYADDSGDIGWQLIGTAPRRGVGGGTLPTDAADPATAWADGPVPYDDMPFVRNPDAGFVATANNQPATEGPYLGSDFLDGYRAARISERLMGCDEWTVPDVLELQMDRASIPWRLIRDTVLAAADTAGLDDITALLRDWDGVVDADSPGAAVFEAFTAALSRAIAEAKAPNSSAYALGAGFTPLVPYNTLLVRRVSHLVALITAKPAGWFADGWDEAIRTALRTAGEMLADASGPDQLQWAWGTVRPVTLVHPMGLRRPFDRVWNIGPLPHGGDANTVNPGPVNAADPFGNPDFAIASGRMAVEVGAWDQARFCLPGGQSGNPFSPHYADQVELWLQGDALVVPMTAPAVERTIRRRLTIIPGPPEA